MHIPRTHRPITFLLVITKLFHFLWWNILLVVIVNIIPDFVIESENVQQENENKKTKLGLLCFHYFNFLYILFQYY